MTGEMLAFILRARRVEAPEEVRDGDLRVESVLPGLFRGADDDPALLAVGAQALVADTVGGPPFVGDDPYAEHPGELEDLRVRLASLLDLRHTRFRRPPLGEDDLVDHVDRHHHEVPREALTERDLRRHDLKQLQRGLAQRQRHRS